MQFNDTFFNNTRFSFIVRLVQNAEPIFVRLEESEAGASDGQQRVAVAAAYIHHNHNPGSLENDIALLKLQKPVQLKSNICLICLPARGSVVQANKRCTASGYAYNADSKSTNATDDMN